MRRTAKSLQDPAGAGLDFEHVRGELRQPGDALDHRLDIDRALVIAGDVLAQDCTDAEVTVFLAVLRSGGDSHEFGQSGVALRRDTGLSRARTGQLWRAVLTKLRRGFVARGVTGMKDLAA